MKENINTEKPPIESTSSRSAVERIVMPHFRVMLMKNDAENYWNVCGNPSWGYFEKLYSDALQNFANDYVEYKNCGVRHRMIRFADIDKYLYDTSTFLYDWALDPSKA